MGVERAHIGKVHQGVDFSAQGSWKVWLGRVVSIIFVVPAINNLIKYLFRLEIGKSVFGDSETIRQPQGLPNDIEKVSEQTLRTPDGRLIRTYHISSHPQKKSNKIVLLFMGSGEAVETHAPSFIRQYQKAGYDILLTSYGGFGVSEGPPSPKNLERDAETAYQYVRDGLGYANNQITAHGFSLGSYPAAYLGRHHTLHETVIDRGFDTVDHVAHTVVFSATNSKIYARIAQFFTWYSCNLNTIKHVKRIKGHVTWIHRADDHTLERPYAQKVQALFKEIADLRTMIVVDNTTAKDHFDHMPMLHRLFREYGTWKPSNGVK